VKHRQENHARLPRRHLQPPELLDLLPRQLNVPRETSTTARSMMTTETTSYGTWCNRVNALSDSPDDDVRDYVGTGDPDWRERLETTGALEQMKADYRAAIDAALPPSVTLCGKEFIGPAHPDDGEFDGYPVNEFGSLDIKAMLSDIDLAAIVERHDPDA
jgi:hypothetical protein